MARSSPPRPTDAELEILRVLWERGPSTVREVHQALGGTRAGGYTTFLKLMQIMTGKGLLLREEAGRAHVYRPSQKEEETQRRVLRHLLERAFGGSARKLIQRALSLRRASPEELARIRELLDELEGGKR